MLNLQLRIASRSIAAWRSIRLGRCFASDADNDQEYTLRGIDNLDIGTLEETEPPISDQTESDSETESLAYSYLKPQFRQQIAKKLDESLPHLLSIPDIDVLLSRQEELDQVTFNDFQALTRQGYLAHAESLFSHPGLALKHKLKLITNVASLQTFENLLSLIKLAIETNWVDSALELQTLTQAFLAGKVENHTSAKDKLRETLTQTAVEQLTPENFILISKLDLHFCKELISELNLSKPKIRKVLLRALQGLSEQRVLPSVMSKEMAKTLVMDSAITDPLVFLGLFQVYRQGDKFEDIKAAVQLLQTQSNDWETRFLKLTSVELQASIGLLDVQDKMVLHELYDRVLLSKRFTKQHRANLVTLLGSMLATGRIDFYFLALRMRLRGYLDEDLPGFKSMSGCRVAYELPLLENPDFAEASGIYVHRALLRKNHGETQIVTSNLEAILSKMENDMQISKLILNISLSGYYQRSFCDARIKQTIINILQRLTFKTVEELETLGTIGFSCFEHLRNQFSCNYLHDPEIELLLRTKIEQALAIHQDSVKSLHNLQKKGVKTELFKQLLTVAVIGKAKFDIDSDLLTIHLARLTPLMNDMLLCVAIHSTLHVPSLQILQAELLKRLAAGGFTFSKLNKIVGSANFYKYLAMIATNKVNQSAKTEDINLSITLEQLRKLPVLQDPKFLEKYLAALPVHQELLEAVQAYANQMLASPGTTMVDSCITESDSAYHIFRPDYYRDPSSALCTLTKDNFRFSYRELLELVSNSTVAGQFGSDFLLSVQRTLLKPEYSAIINKSSSLEAKIFSKFLKSSSVRMESVWSKIEEFALRGLQTVSFRQQFHRHLAIMSAFATSKAGSSKFWDAYEEYTRRLFEFQSKHGLSETEKLMIFRMCSCLAVSRKFKDVNLINSGIVKLLDCEKSPFELSKLIKFVGPHMTDFETIKQIVHKYTETLTAVKEKQPIQKQIRAIDHKSIKRKIKDFKNYSETRVKFNSFEVHNKDPQTSTK